MLDVELEAMKPEDLGHIDTFREEENQVLRGAVDALKAQEWAKAADWARAREGEKSFWLGRDPERRRTWNLVAEAATFGTVLAQHPRPFETLHDFEDALTRYAESASQVDRAHRHFEQEWLRRLDTQMPHYGALQEVLGALRGLYRAWADALARDFTRLCTAEGFLPPLHLQQRTLYEAVVQPITHGGERIAIFLVDAFRYEMATELLDELKALAGGAVVDLKARLAELPAITSVGMNALAPASREGRLEVAGAFKGFRSGETLIKTPADRAKAMGMRTSGMAAAYLTLANVCESTPEALKSKLKEHQVAVVCSTDIDEAGESGLGLLTFEAQLRQLKAAWHHLQTAGFKHALFTADHGFLLQDSTTRVRPFGKKTDPHPRYVLDDHERGESGIVPIALSKLGYVGISGYLLVHEDTSVFATPASGASFVHGGNSPEERIIPVLTVTRKRAESSSLTDYAVEAEPMAAAFGFHRMRVRLTLPRQSQTSLGFAAARSIELDLRVPERRDIRVTLKEISGAGRLRSGRLHAPVGDEWSEVFFELVGPTDERVHVEIYHADNIEKVRPCIPDARFAVSGLMGDGRSGSRAPSTPPPASSWAEAFEEEGVRRVFLHIEKHGAITEGEIIAILGNSRAARRFSLKFDEYLAKLPFRVRSEAGSSGKRYVREEEK